MTEDVGIMLEGTLYFEEGKSLSCKRVFKPLVPRVRCPFHPIIHSIIKMDFDDAIMFRRVLQNYDMELINDAWKLLI